MRYLFLFISLFTYSVVQGQAEEDAAKNIIPNPGFELYSGHPVGWFYNGKHFTNVMKYWSSATAASPDIFGPKTKVPQLWKDKGFGNTNPIEGASMVGLTLVGCGDGKPHCREYIQTPLNEALVVGQKYVIDFWVNRLDGGYQLKEIGVVFTNKRTYKDDDSRLQFEKVFIAKPLESKDNTKAGWIKMRATFTASDPSDYMIIGNFYNDLDSNVSRADDHQFSFGYYYIDDFDLHKIAPIIDAPETRTTWEGKELVPPATFTLTNIFFDTDEYILLPRSFSELDKLAELMRLYPKMVIRINGHTDSDGGEAYNDTLSMNRAEAVEKYLLGKDITSNRLSVQGFGLHNPVASNTTAEGRQLNRRVEFTIIAM